MIIPGSLVTLATFPGVIVHEAAHLLFCRLRRVAVLDVCFFRFGNPAGYVMHAGAADFTTTFLIAVGPFLVNSLLCVLICFPAMVPVQMFGHRDALSLVVLWLGVSIGMHAFPSTGDAKALWHAATASAGRLNPLALLSLPLVVVIYAANSLSVLWFDCLYGLAIGLALPAFVLGRLL